MVTDDDSPLEQPTDKMQIVAAVFAEDIQLAPAPGPATRIDLTGIQFSAPADNDFPYVATPHLVVLVWNPPGGKPVGALEVRFVDESAMKLKAQNVQPLQIEPGKFNYRLVRAELEFDQPATIVARCRIDTGTSISVPYTVLAPTDDSD